MSFFIIIIPLNFSSPCPSQAPVSHRNYRPRLPHVVTSQGDGCLSFLMATWGMAICATGNQGVWAQGTSHLCPLPGAAVSWASESQPTPHLCWASCIQVMGAASRPRSGSAFSFPWGPTLLLGHPSPSQRLVSLPTSCGWSADVRDTIPPRTRLKQRQANRSLRMRSQT